jgi:hypothetical protein
MILFQNFFDKFSIYSDFSKKSGENAPGSQIAALILHSMVISKEWTWAPCAGEAKSRHFVDLVLDQQF